MPPKLSFDHVKKTFTDADCELISTTYVNQDELLNFKCSCGSLGKVSYKGFKYGQRCHECLQQRKKDTIIEKYGSEINPQLKGLKNHQQAKKHKYKEVKEFYETNGCDLLAIEYKNNLDKMWFMWKIRL